MSATVAARPAGPRRLTRDAVLAVEVAADLVRTRRSLARGDLPAQLHRIRASTPARWAPGRGDTALLAAATVRVLGCLPGDTRCLTRSLVLARLLARRGLEFTLVIGVGHDAGFAAHAWIERRGAALLPPGGTSFGRLVEL